MAEVDKLIPKLRALAERLFRISSGAEERQSFIELFGAESLDRLMEEYDPKEHNAEWDGERQKPVPEPDKIMKARRAIAFMASGQKGLYKQYGENELRLHTLGMARANRSRYCLKEALDFMTMDSYKHG